MACSCLSGGYPYLRRIRLTRRRRLVGGSRCRTIEMQVVDMYRREGDRLAQNWVFIDLLHYLRLSGVDVLGRFAGIHG